MRELQVVLARLQQVRGHLPCLLHHLARSAVHRGPAHDERAGAVGVHALGAAVAVHHLDVLEGHPEHIGGDLAPAGHMTLPVRVVPVTTSTLPVGSMRMLAASQPPAAYRRSPQHPAGREPAHLRCASTPIPRRTKSPRRLRSACSARSLSYPKRASALSVAAS